MDYSAIFKTVYDFTIRLARSLSNFWEFLTTKQTIGFTLNHFSGIFSVFNFLIDFINSFSFSFVPLNISITVLLTLMAISWAKKIIPFL